MNNLFFSIAILLLATNLSIAKHNNSFERKLPQTTSSIEVNDLSGLNFQTIESLTDKSIKVATLNIEEDDALKCKVTMSVTIKDPLTGSSATATGTVEGPCDEVKAAAIALVKELVAEAEKLL